LKKLVDNDWDWQVKRISDSDFLVVFPNSVSLNLCKNTGGLTLPISKVSMLFVEPRCDAAAAASLSKVWVLLSGVPEVLRRSDLLLEATKMLGRPRSVEEASLVGSGPIRMLFHSPNPAGLPDSIMLFANLQGFKIGVKVEMPKDKEPAFPAQSLRDPADDDDETDDMSRSETHWKCLPPKGDGRDKPSTADQGGSNQQQPPPANQQHQQASDAPLPKIKPSPSLCTRSAKGTTRCLRVN
jgi:hypothetical protein